MEQVILAFGSNLGARRDNIRSAAVMLDARGVRVLKMSSFFATSPVGGPMQGDFINSAALAETSLEPMQLLEAAKDIERRLGRDPRAPHWGPRVIDIDIIFYGRRTVAEEGLSIPHPLFAERMFVLAPLLEIAPDFILPSGEVFQAFFRRRVAEFDFSLQMVEKLP